MARYVIKCEFKALYIELQKLKQETIERNEIWARPYKKLPPKTVAKKTLTSRVFEFPNEIRKGQEIRLNQKKNGFSDVVQSDYHNVKGKYTVLHFGIKGIHGSDKDKLKQEFDELVEKYSFIKEL